MVTGRVVRRDITVVRGVQNSLLQHKVSDENTRVCLGLSCLTIASVGVAKGISNNKLTDEVSFIRKLNKFGTNWCCLLKSFNRRGQILRLEAQCSRLNRGDLCLTATVDLVYKTNTLGLK